MLPDGILPGSPYPGLRPFEAEDAHLFFGREQQVDALLERLHASRLVAVVGESGAGKSSLVRAGLLPALEAGFLAEAGSDWRFVVMRPGSAPLDVLAGELLAPGVLSEEGGTPEREFAGAELRRGPLGLIQLIKDAHLPEHTNLLLVVDQFEELFRYTTLAHKGEAEAFVELLLRSVRQREAAIFIVLTMRSDFIGECARFRGLPEALNDNQFLTPRLTREQIGLAIRGPARVFGGDVEDVLIAELANEVGDDPDQLPLLQHLLMRLWEHAVHRQSPPLLTLALYRELGGFRAALDQHAEQIYMELAPKRRALAERLFKSLCGSPEGRRDIRRPTRAGEVVAAAASEMTTLVEVVEAFRGPGRHFLMPPSGVALAADTQLDISHESLIRQWQRLQQWVEDEAANAREFLGLRDEALRWKAGKGELILGHDLLRAVDWRQRAKPTPGWAGRYASSKEYDAVIMFVAASEKEENRQRDEKQAVLEREAAAATKLLRLSWVLGALFVAAGVLGAYGWYAKGMAEEAQAHAKQKEKEAADARKIAEDKTDDAERARDEAQEATNRANSARVQANKDANDAADARKIAEDAAAALERQRNLVIAQKLGVEAMVELNTEPEGALRKARESVRGDRSNALAEMTLRRAIGTYVPSIKYEGVQRSKNRSDTGLFYLPFFVGPGSFSPIDDRIVLPTGTGNRAEIREFATAGRPIIELIGHTDIVGSASFSPDGRMVVTTSGDKNARLFDAASGKLLHTLPHHAAVNSAVFDATGESLLTATDMDVDRREGEVVLWDIKNRRSKILTPMTHPDDVRYAGFSPDGRWILSLTQSGKGAFWDAASGGQPNQLQLSDDNSRPTFPCDGLVGVKPGITSSPDRKTLAVLAPDGRATLLDAATLQPKPTQLPTQERFCSLAWNHDGSRIAGAHNDGTARVFDASNGALWRETPKRPDTVLSVAFDPEDRLLTAGSDKTLRLWDLRRGAIQVAVLRAHTELVGSALFSPDGRHILSAADDSTARIWKLSGGGKLRSYSEKGLSIEQAAFSSNGLILSILAEVRPGPQRQIREVDLRSQGELGGIVKGTLPETLMPYSLLPGGRQVLVIATDGSVRSWDVETSRFKGMAVAESSSEAGPNLKLLVSSDGSHVAVFLDGKLIALSSLASSNLPRPAPAPLRFKYDVKKCEPAALSQDGGQIALRCEDPRTHDVRIGVPERESPDRIVLDFPVEIRDASFDPTGKYLAVSLRNQNQAVHVLELTPPKGREAAILIGHTAVVTNMQFNKTGTMLATSSEDGTVRVWNAATGRPLSLVIPPEAPKAVSFGPNDRLILIQMEQSVAVWDCPVCGNTENILAEADRLLGGLDGPLARAPLANTTARRATP